jgi:hypothetical protein
MTDVSDSKSRQLFRGEGLYGRGLGALLGVADRCSGRAREAREHRSVCALQTNQMARSSAASDGLPSFFSLVCSMCPL